MTTHYIQTLGVAKCREILKWMPEGAEDVVIANNGKVVFLKNAIFGLAFYASKKCWIVANPEIKKYLIRLDDLRAELSAHDTDSCTDIRNHVSPNTLVLEQNLQEQFQEANELECGR